MFSLYYFFFMRHCLCLQSLYLPFISASLAPLSRAGVWETVTFSQPVMFLQITEGLWSCCTPHCQGLRQAHAICQIDGKVAEWGWDTLCWSILLSFMCHIWMSCGSHTFVICCWGTRLKDWPPQHTNTHTHRQERIMVLRNYSTCGHQSLNETIIVVPSLR